MTQQLALFKTVRQSQTDKVLAMLRDAKMGVCATDFNRAYIPRFGARLKELRDAGHLIEKRKCFSHNHHTHQVRYVLIAPKHRLSLSE